MVILPINQNFDHYDLKEGNRSHVERYIARQPIFNQKMKVHAYELLYRSRMDAPGAKFSDGDRATRSLLSDAITVFGLSNLTNAKLAFVNFSESLLLSDFALLADPREMAIEILEHTRVSALLIQKLQMLKSRGYQLALDDYTGNPMFDPILPLIDILKVDFRAVTTDVQHQIAQQFKGSPVTLLAEKVETVEDFHSASKMGYTLFQGYFFEKPTVMQKRAPALAASSYIRLFRELAQPEIDIDRCAHIVHSDAVLTYSLFQKVRTLQYYRGNSIQSIKLALVFLGTDNVRRWVILLLARERNITLSDELVRSAYLRAVFTERLMEYSPFYVRQCGWISRWPF
jgi:EAL and modified HD-GYP domain-containing signal transduction protein